MDKTMMVWEQTEEADTEDMDQVWMEKVRVGEVGGNTLGFLGAVWAEGGDSILGYSWGGAFHLWREREQAGGVWGPGVIGGGHQQGVVDLSWEREGRYLVTVSRDQTARIHAQVILASNWSIHVLLASHWSLHVILASNWLYCSGQGAGECGKRWPDPRCMVMT